MQRARSSSWFRKYSTGTRMDSRYPFLCAILYFLRMALSIAWYTTSNECAPLSLNAGVSTATQTNKPIFFLIFSINSVKELRGDDGDLVGVSLVVFVVNNLVGHQQPVDVLGNVQVVRVMSIGVGFRIWFPGGSRPNNPSLDVDPISLADGNLDGSDADAGTLWFWGFGGC